MVEDQQSLCQATAFAMLYEQCKLLKSRFIRTLSTRLHIDLCLL